MLSLIIMLTDNGNESHLLTLHEGDMFGERALIKKEARQANIIASGPVECYYLESQDFYAMLGKSCFAYHPFRVRVCELSW
jgi:CRP-like cAMP-binding protein